MINKTIIFLARMVLLSSCSSKNDVSLNDNNQISQEIELSNYKEYEIDENIVQVGTERLYYLRGETSQLTIKNLPDNNYKIVVNGIESNKTIENGYWIYPDFNKSLGHKRNLIQIFNADGKSVLKEYIEHEVGEIRPTIQSDHGKYLFKGISTIIEISNLSIVSCPNIKLVSEGCEIENNSDGTYSIKPTGSSDTVSLNIKVNHLSFDRTFEVLNPPPPKLKFIHSKKLKCISLEPSKMFDNLEYSIVKINGTSSSSNDKLAFVNRACISDSLDFNLSKIIYKIKGSDYFDTLRMR